MKNFMLIALNLSIIVFVIAGVMAFANFTFGTNIGFKGAAIPGDPAIGVLSFMIAAFCYGVNFLVTRKS